MTVFHDRSFDDATRLKLELFRGYIREWLPVFLTRRGGTRANLRCVGIYDFFAGPGCDAEGNPGSPVIIAEEIKQFCRTHPELKAGVDVHMVFNDLKQGNIDQLTEVIQSVACPKPCCHVEYSSQPFPDSLGEHLPQIRDKGSANLIIMDQFGVKEVTPSIIRQLAECSATDILFFISSSYIKRFIRTPELGGKFDMEAEEVKSVDYNAIHRYVCSYFREELQGREYYLAPFSIKKGSNVYGVVFGSGHLYGLDKFLKVCWAKDQITGEANYNIDGDFAWAEQSLLPELNTIRKVQLFERALNEYIVNCSPDNRELYKFSLLHGFSTVKTRETLKSMQNRGELTVTEITTGQPARKGAFYVNQNGYQRAPRVKFTMRSTA